MKRILRKLAGANSEHLSRFHTRQGDMAGIGTLFGLGAACVARVLPIATRERKLPWMAPAAVAFLEKIMQPEWTLLELGSGKSTAWYSARVAKVVCIEPDERWADIVRSSLPKGASVSILEASTEHALPEAMRDNRADITIVDHRDEARHTRLDSIRLIARHQHRPRVVVLDDSDREQYQAAGHLLSTWKRHDFVGFRSRPLALTQTTVWIRPSCAAGLSGQNRKA